MVSEPRFLDLINTISAILYLTFEFQIGSTNKKFFLEKGHSAAVHGGAPPHVLDAQGRPKLRQFRAKRCAMLRAGRATRPRWTRDVAPLRSLLRAMAGRRDAAGRRLLGAGCATMRAGRATLCAAERRAWCGVVRVPPRDFFVVAPPPPAAAPAKLRQCRDG
ncbi:hypothetical protein F511_45959 [Dorcoceras hygrometricum]|uniref:Uncharacterized protein n=1 Tax=Dorcoceras hygrometricum TaxID=472368 RepID=A0A2Z6ZUQ1_9LAMI|nr:hypothetical protein F511_45959 [Dorcoceras hygrometricum]